MIYVVSLIAVVLAVVLDQYTKYLASAYLMNEPLTLIEGVFELRYLENRGAAFGLLQNQQVFFLIVGSGAILVITYLFVRMPHNKHFLPLRLCMISIVAGAIGNMIDRIRLNYVVDFLYFELIDFPIFNVADIYASVATCVLMGLFLFYYKEEDFNVLFELFSLKKGNKQV
jgi:signal peptidase II